MTESDLAAFAAPTAVVRALPFIAHLPPEVRNLVFAGFEERTYRFGETVTTPDDGAFVVIVEGDVRVITEGLDHSEVSLGVLGPGQSSGERGLVDGDSAGVTLRAASSAVRVLRLDRAVALALIRAYPETAAGFGEQAKASGWPRFFAPTKRSGRLDAEGVELIVERGREVKFEAGDIIAREGDQSDLWWIVESGRLVEHTGEGPARRDVRFLRAGDVFGEIGAVERGTRLTTVAAVSDCTVLELDAAVLDELARFDPGFAARLNDRARLHLSRVAVRPLDFGGDDAASSVRQRPAIAPPSEDERMAAGVAVADEPAQAEPWVAPRKFPLVRQIDFADCGVAALAMVCRAFGRKVSLPFIRHAAATGQEGTSLRGIMRAAEEAGLEGHAMKASKDRLDETPASRDHPLGGQPLDRRVRGRRRPRACRRSGTGPAAAEPRRGQREMERLVRDVPADTEVRRRSCRAPRPVVGPSIRAPAAQHARARDGARDRGDRAPTRGARRDAARRRRGRRRQLQACLGADHCDRRAALRRARDQPVPAADARARRGTARRADARFRLQSAAPAAAQVLRGAPDRRHRAAPGRPPPGAGAQSPRRSSAGSRQSSS